MDVIDKAYDRACCELDNILQLQTMSKQDVEIFGQLVDIMKDIVMMDEPQMNGYSQMNGGSYNGGDDYGRGRSMSMYGGRGSSYARGNGYSRGSNKDEVLDQLKYIMDMTSDEKDRKAISRLMEQMSER